ncbi:hypothetical protein [Clostridium tyrobutyricum]|uniref:hypothetical protein n=1 Tax=Clostridium tyrobutyricum TaxID=1519 RepID=UPI0020CE5DF4|nr:hypothetical protein [Clostridium tyrobutyricum]
MNRLREGLKYKYWNCYLDVGLYPQSFNKNIGLTLIDIEDDSPIAKITVNPERSFPQTHMCIKDYSENDGMLEFVEKNRIAIIDDTATCILMESGQVAPCLRIATDIYEEYLKILDRYKKESPLQRTQK